jgi:hypothetical protein
MAKSAVRIYLEEIILFGLELLVKRFQKEKSIIHLTQIEDYCCFSKELIVIVSEYFYEDVADVDKFSVGAKIRDNREFNSLRSYLKKKNMNDAADIVERMILILEKKEDGKHS